MAKKTNCVVRGVPMYRVRVKIGDEFKNFYGESKKQAELKRDQHIEIIEIVSDGTFAELFESWLDGVHKVSLAPSSYLNYESTWRVHLKGQKFATKKFEEVTSMDIQIALNSIDSNYRKGRAKLLLNTFYRYYLNQPNRKIQGNPIDTVKIPKIVKVRNEKLCLDKKEVALLMQEFNNNFNIFIYVFAAFTGLRQGEILALKVKDVDFDKNIVSVYKSVKYLKVDGKMQFHTKAPKTDKSIRDIPLYDAIVIPLKRQILLVKERHIKYGMKYSNDALLFPNGVLSTKRAAHVLTAWKKEQKKLKQIAINNKIDAFSDEISFHTLRHTFCSMLCVSGTPLRTAADLMGHSGIDMVATIYAHTDMEYMRTAIDKLGDYYKDVVL